MAIEDDAPEEMRLKYRFLDLRKERVHSNIMLRSKVIARTRELMREKGFTEFQTPILTASSPEGARDFLLPSRLNPGKFYDSLFLYIFFLQIFYLLFLRFYPSWFLKHYKYRYHNL